MAEVTSITAGSEGGPQLRPPERLSEHHDVSSFDCGHRELNDWLARQATASEAKSARTYVVARDARVIAYYCLAAGSVIRSDLPRAKLRKNMPDQVPIIVIGRLAVDLKFQGRGFGQALLKDATLRILTAHDAVGVRAILVHAIDDKACDFYRRFGFLPTLNNSRTLVLPIETVKQALSGLPGTRPRGPR